MSYFPMPKSLDKLAALFQRRKWTFATLSTDAFPVPSAAQIASQDLLTLIHTDTGSQYIYTGTTWVSTHFSGAINVHDADVHHFPVNEYFFRLTGVSSTLSVAAVSGDTQITLTSAASFAIGDELQIADGDYEIVFPTITAIAGNLVTLDRPLDFAHAIGTTVAVVTSNMNANGTLGAPVSFKLYPPVGQTWHILRIIFTITHATAGDLGLFGNLLPLTHGVVLRAYIGGQNYTYTNWKTNEDKKTDMFDVEFDVRSGGGGTFGTSGRGTFKRVGVAVKLDGTAGDYLEVLIQDNLSTLVTYKIKGQGHPTNA